MNASSRTPKNLEWNLRKETRRGLRNRLRALYVPVPMPCSDDERDAMARADKVRGTHRAVIAHLMGGA